MSPLLISQFCLKTTCFRLIRQPEASQGSYGYLLSLQAAASTKADGFDDIGDEE